MNVWLNEITKLTNLILVKPAGETEFLISGIVVIFTLLFSFTKLADILGAPISTLWRSLLVLAVGLIFWFGVNAALDIYFLAKTPKTLIKWIPVITGIITITVVMAPLSLLLQRIGYMKALWLIILSMAAALAMELLAAGACRAFLSERVNIDRTKQRTDEMNNFLSK